MKFFNLQNWNRIKYWLVCLAVLASIIVLTCWSLSNNDSTIEEIEEIIIEEIEEITVPKAKVEEPTVRYKLTDYERTVVEKTVMCESGAEPYVGQLLIAQCILNTCEKENIRPDAAVVQYQYASYPVEVSDSVKMAVSTVFDLGGQVKYFGDEIESDKVLYFYSPQNTYSAWHESMRFICEVGGHKFFGDW